jgi:hypothetical protein
LLFPPGSDKLLYLFQLLLQGLFLATHLVIIVVADRLM